MLLQYRDIDSVMRRKLFRGFFLNEAGLPWPWIGSALHFHCETKQNLLRLCEKSIFFSHLVRASRWNIEIWNRRETYQKHVKRKEIGNKKLWYFLLRSEKGNFVMINFVIFRLEAKWGDLKVEQKENKAKKYALFKTFIWSKKLEAKRSKTNFFRFQNPNAKTFLMRNQSILPLTILTETNSRKKQLQN